MSKIIRLPNALVIGAPKSGTTSLYYYLRQHPDIFLPRQKELHYFSYNWLQQNVNGPGDRNAMTRLCATREQYETFYLDAKTERVIAEISPSYLYYCQVSERIAAELGPVKIIVILRNPTKKAFSQYMHQVQRKRETLSFYEALMAEPERREAGWSDMWRYAESSLYTSRIEKYISMFGESNVKIILMDELAQAPLETLHKLFEFLEIDANFSPDTSKIYNKSGVPRSNLVNNFLFRPGKLKTIVTKFISGPVRGRIKERLIKANLNKGKSDEESEAYLASYFQTDILALEETIGRQTGWIQ